MTTSREEDTNARLRVMESEVGGEKAMTRRVFVAARPNGEEIAAVRVDIATSRLQAQRAADDIAIVKAAQLSQGAMLNILVQDMREIRSEMGAMHADMSEMRMEMGEMGTEMSDMRMEIGRMRTRLDEIERSMDAKFDAVLGAIGAIGSPTSPFV